MKNTFGSNVSVTVFGESHGASVGAVIDGLPAGIKIDTDFLALQLKLRRPFGKISTDRCEKDEFIIESGVFGGFTTGTPICIVIPNTDTVSADYDINRGKARPSHADYTAFCKYNGFEDYRGGGHFSGRITAAIVAAGAIAISFLKTHGIYIGSHIKRIADCLDRDFENLNADIEYLNKTQFACLDSGSAEKMQSIILNAGENGDSVGGILETAVTGMPTGVGEPWFDSIESLLSHALFSIPAVKGVEFGLGFGFAETTGSKANDEFCISDGRIVTKTNNNGGINGGISNGMPIIFRTAVKPTPTISKPQNTVDFIHKTETVLVSSGRHDPSVVHRARVVVDSVTALTLCDLLINKLS